MNLVVTPAGEISGEVEAPPSKLHTQMACALAVLCEGKSTIGSPLRVKDTTVMLKALETFGATVKRTQEKWSIWGTSGDLKPVQNVLDAKNSGTALRLLTSIACLSRTPCVVNGDVQLRSRTMPEFIRALRNLGADVHSTKPDDSPPFIIFGGGIRGGKVELTESEAPYAPAILLPTPYARKETEFKIRAGRGLQVETALELMKVAGAKITRHKGRILIARRPYRPFDYSVRKEVAGAAPFIVAAGLTDSRLRLRGAKNLSPRDMAFIRAIKLFGVDIRQTRKGINIDGTHGLRATKLDLSWAPELLPLIAVLACRSKGRTLIRNAERAKRMKSDRISAIARELRRMGAKVLEREDGLIIQGPARLRGCEVDGHGDHSVAAALAVAGLVADGKTVVKNGGDALGTSYSRFLSTFQHIGADMSYST